MEFNQLILEKLHPLFTEHGLTIAEESKDIVKYESKELIILLVHNPREKSNTLWVSSNLLNSVEIDNELMQKFFNSDLKLSNLPKEIFINNVFLFFISEGEKLLDADKRVLTALVEFNEQRSKEFTANLVERQYLEAANKAWYEGSYSDVVRYLEKVSKDNLSASFKQKYKIAQKRLSN